MSKLEKKVNKAIEQWLKTLPWVVLYFFRRNPDQIQPHLLKMDQMLKDNPDPDVRVVAIFDNKNETISYKYETIFRHKLSISPENRAWNQAQNIKI